MTKKTTIYSVAIILTALLFSYGLYKNDFNKKQVENLGLAVYDAVQGGTGTSTAPVAGDILLSWANGSYGPTSIIAGSGITLSTSTYRQLSISSSASGLSSYDAWTHPTSGVSATTSEIRITGGLISTASTTFSGNATTTGNHNIGGNLCVGTDVCTSDLTVSSAASFRSPLSGTTFHVIGANNSPLRAVFDTNNAATNFGTLIQGRRSRGPAASPSAVTGGDVLLQLAGAGYGSTDYVGSGGSSKGIIAIKAGSSTWTDTNSPSRIEFFTVPGSSVTNALRFTIDQTGAWGIGGTASQVTSDADFGDAEDVFVSQGNSAAPVWTNNLTLNRATTSSLYVSGNVGIGTSTPYAPLSVVGEAVARNFTATSTTATSTFPRLSITTGISILGEYFENFTTYVRSLFTGGRSITVTNGQFDADSELYTYAISANLFATSTSGISTTSEAFVSVYVPFASTITNFNCYADDSGTSTIKATHTTNPLSAGTNILYTSGASCGSQQTLSTTTFSATAISAGSWIRFYVSDAEPTGSRPRVVYPAFTLTKDD